MNTIYKQFGSEVLDLVITKCRGRRVRARIYALMGGGTTAGGGRAACALRLLLLLVLTLAAVEYLFGSIFDASHLRTYLYFPLHNATQPTFRNLKKLQADLGKVHSTMTPKQNPDVREAHLKNNTVTVNNTNTSNIINNFTSIKNVTALTSITINDIHVNVTPIPLLITKLMEGVKNRVMIEEELKKTEPMLPLCEATPPDLGPVPVNKTKLKLDFVENKYPEVQWGGRYIPPNCTARHKVAIIVPYRDRQQHLAIFLNHMHPFLMKQQIEYGIFIIEQEGKQEFNRGKLMNVGFKESQKLEPDGWQCFIFHDIDLLPQDTRNMYTCPRQPRHMSAAIDKLHYKLPYQNIFGGVSAITKEQFTNVNGFSNKYWGWGGEDNDIFARLTKMNYHLSRYKISIARYSMLNHKKSLPNRKRYQLLSQTGKTFPNEGLSTLEYERVRVTRYHLYTYILANIDERS